MKVVKKTTNKKLSKYIVALDYVDKTLLALSATSGVASIGLIATVIDMSVKKVCGSLHLVFSFIDGIAKYCLKTLRKKKLKHNEIVLLAKHKLYNMEIQCLNH